MFSLDDVRSPYCLYCLSRSVVISILSIVHTLSEYCLYVPKIENPPKVQPSIHRHSSIQHTAYLFQHVFHYPATMEYTILPYTTSTRLYSSLLYSTLLYYVLLYSVQWLDILRALPYLAAGACRYVDASRSHFFSLFSRAVRTRWLSSLVYL